MQNKKLREQVVELTNNISALSNKLDRVVAQLAHHGETLASVITLVGEEQVKQKMVDLRAERKEKMESKQADGVAVMVAQGVLVSAETIGPESFLVVHDINKDGTRTRAQFELAGLESSKQAKYLGKQVGYEVELPGRGKLVISEVYNIVHAKVAEHAVAAANAAQAAQAAAATVAQAEQAAVSQ